ncbi:MAG: ribonuclease domain-containing protein [Peptoniphilaceae bacterium]|nr:ribonuclease domain-containing protein [Peptoniphilaceae bacterium]MDY6019313.1 ribonuclease domain-containing protein [Anaerococcus sp.]
MKRLKNFRILEKLVLCLILMISFSACTRPSLDQSKLVSDQKSVEDGANVAIEAEESIEEDKPYYKMEDVAAYIHLYNKLPKNYLSKKQAREKGWLSKENNLWLVTEKGVIGGDRFGNYEKTLPDSSYKEADVNYEGGKRGKERLVYDEKGNIFYSKDHYKTFERIY